MRIVSRLTSWIRQALYGRSLGALVGFVLLTLLFTYPLGFLLADHVAWPAGDPLINVWILRWDVHALLTDPTQLFQANIFYPYPYSLAYNEHLLPSAAIFLPLHLIWGDSMVAYELLNLLTFVLCGFGGYLLGRRVTRSYWGGLLAGIVFAFCPFKMSQIHHFQILSAQWFPFVLLFLDRSIARGRPRDLVLLGLFVFLQILSCGYYGLFLIVGICLVILPLLLGHHWRQWRRLLARLWRLGLEGLVTGLLLLPFFLPYARATELTEGGRRSVGYVAQLSPDVLNYLAAPASNRLYGDLTAPLRKEPEGSLLPGVTAVALASIGMVVGLRSRYPCARGRTIAWVVLTAGAGLLSLGPTIQVAGQSVIRGPYILLYRYFPGFGGVRVPGRFAVLVMLGLAVLAAMGVTYLLGRIPSRPWRSKAALAAVVLLGVEFASFPVPVEQVDLVGSAPAVYQWLAEQPDDFAIVELPIDVYPSFEYDIPYMVQSTYHWKRLVNGHTSNFPAGHLALAELLQRFPDEMGVQTLRALDVRYVLVHRQLLSQATAERFDALASAPLAGFTRVGLFDDAEVYRLEAPDARLAGLNLGEVSTRPFLLNGWSRHDDRDGDRSFVWGSSSTSAMLVPVWGAARGTLSIEARSSPRAAAGAGAPANRCQIVFDGIDLGECQLSDEWGQCQYDLPDAVTPGLHMAEWQCDLADVSVMDREIGATGVVSPVDLAGAIAGIGAGDYADLYVDGKRYATGRDCSTCVGLLTLQGGDAAAVHWREIDTALPAQIDEALAWLRELPAGAFVVAAARAKAGGMPALRAALSACGAADAFEVGEDDAYLLIGVLGAQAGSALEIACQDGCTEYLGAPWPKRSAAVAGVRIGP